MVHESPPTDMFGGDFLFLSLQVEDRSVFNDNFIWHQQLMHDADKYNKEMKLLEAAKSIYKNWK